MFMNYRYIVVIGENFSVIILACRDVVKKAQKQFHDAH